MSASITLLIVDGHRGVREALARRLRHTPGIAVVEAVDGAGAAVRVAQEVRPDAIIYDPRTVQGNAAETIRCLSKDGCPVVVLTSSLLEGEAATLACVGTAAVLLKGNSIAELVACIEMVVATHCPAQPWSSNGSKEG